MKFGHLIEYNITNIFIEKSYKKCQNQNSPYLWISSLKYYIVCCMSIVMSIVCYMSKSRAAEIYWNSGTEHLLLPHINLFQKSELELELVCLSHFLHNFWTKLFLTLYSINWPNFIAWLPQPFEISDNILIVILCYSLCDVWSLKFTSAFLSRCWLSCMMTKKSGQKIKYLKNERRF